MRAALEAGGRATTLIDGWITVLDGAGDALPVVPVAEVPMTLAGLSRSNVENALAAASASATLGVGLEAEAVAVGLRDFAPGPELNPGRMNVYSLGARGADHVVVVHKQRYLRGRDTGDLDALYALGAHAVGVDSLRSHDSELGGLQALVARAGPGDVVAVMTHQDREQLDGWLRERGATVDTPADLRRKVAVPPRRP